MTTQQMYDALESVYLEWVNNYLTIGKFAEHLQIEPDQADELIDALRSIFEK